MSPSSFSETHHRLRSIHVGINMNNISSTKFTPKLCPFFITYLFNISSSKVTHRRLKVIFPEYVYPSNVSGYNDGRNNRYILL